MKRSMILAVGIAALDQAVKAYVRTFEYGEVFFEIPGVLALKHSVNTGAAFSAFSGKTPMLAILSLILLAAMYGFACGKMRLVPVARIALGCMFGGGIGNLMDRVLFSGVTDYICLLFVEFPIFNLADVAITCAIGVLLILVFMDRLEEPAEEEHESSR